MINTSFIAIFSTGLFTGGLTCVAVQGGLLAATIAQREEERLKEKTKKSGNAWPIIYFLATKLFAYTLLGVLLGWFGSLFELSLGLKVFMQFVAAVFMIGAGLSLLEVHPVFRYFVIQPPKFLTRIVRNQSKSNDIFAPALLGFFTVFIPCGTTQAMMALAIASGSPLVGAAIMFAFTFGTSPLFFILGYFASKIGDFWHKKFMKVAAFTVILLALFSLNGAIALTGSQYTLSTPIYAMICSVKDCTEEGAVGTNEQQSVTGTQPAIGAQEPSANFAPATVSEVTITISPRSYSPKSFAVKAGSVVTVNLVNTSDSQSCTQSFTIPKLKIQKVVTMGNSSTFTFTAPTSPSPVAFMCGMGMYRGVINVL